MTELPDAWKKASFKEKSTIVRANRTAGDGGTICERNGINMFDVCDMPSDAHTQGDEIIGSHPMHGSDTKTNFHIHSDGSMWHCERHQTGGDALTYVAMREGFIECVDAGPLDADTVIRCVEVLRRDGLIQEPEQEPEQIPQDAERSARALDILENKDPIDFILTTFNTLHVGDREVGEGRLLSTAAQHVLNSLGLQSKLTGGSGKGKSDAEKKMAWLHPQEYYVYARLTDKAIYYHPNLKQASTIFSDDVSVSTELEGIIKEATSNFQRETTRILPVRDAKGNYHGETQTIPERLNWALTSVRTQGSDELIKRQMGYDVDTSPEQDKAYIEFEKSRSLKAVEELPTNDDVLTCREIIRIIKENDDGTMRLIGVDMPFVERIEWADTENRRNFNMFEDMVRAFAMLRFLQRDRSDDGNIIATLDDFHDAERHYNQRAGMQALHLDESQKKFCQHIAALGGEADTPTMQTRMNLSRTRIYEIADSLEKIYPAFHSEIRRVPVGDDEKKTTNRRFYELFCDTREGFTLDDYSGVVYLKPEAKDE
jgi:hypothetical protein